MSSALESSFQTVENYFRSVHDTTALSCLVTLRDRAFRFKTHLSFTPTESALMADSNQRIRAIEILRMKIPGLGIREAYIIVDEIHRGKP